MRNWPPHTFRTLHFPASCIVLLASCIVLLASCLLCSPFDKKPVTLYHSRPVVLDGELAVPSRSFERACNPLQQG